jgi:serine/threonine-protein kinase HipA
LLAVDDASRVGALRFRDEDGVFRRAQEEALRTAPPLIELGHLLSASRAVEANKASALLRIDPGMLSKTDAPVW